MLEMNVDNLKEKIAEAREASKERGFTQTFDMIVNLKQIDLKKPEHKVDVGVTLQTNVKAKKLKICAVVEKGLEGVEDIFDGVIYSSDLEKLKGDISEIRKVTHAYDKFVVQSSVMPNFAQVLGRYLGPMNKMPSPKMGMVITDKTPLQPLYDKLQKTVHVATRKNTVIQLPIGSEQESDGTIAENIIQIREALKSSLPNNEHNIGEVYIKLTMGKLVVI